MATINSAKLMDGRPLARRVLEAARAKVQKIVAATGVTPALATVLVGDDRASATYVRMKRKRCEDVGMKSVRIELPLGTTTDQLVAEIRKLATDPSVHGILIQHPVPAPIEKRTAFEAIPVEKDVDGVTSSTLGRVILGMPAYASCTPAGIMRLLREYSVELDGAHAVVIGRSPILGRPMASLLINAQATVTLCHSRTRSLPSLVRAADVCDRGCRQAAVRARRMDQSRGRRDRRGLQRGQHRRRGFRRRARAGVADHAGAGRRGADDDCDIDRSDSGRRGAPARRAGLTACPRRSPIMRRKAGPPKVCRAACGVTTT
jgi:methylenetetrahydrofolate dehydrogenase (NADP+)/methenyltetrahydrofolate cyclohydrolase